MIGWSPFCVHWPSMELVKLVVCNAIVDGESIVVDIIPLHIIWMLDHSTWLRGWEGEEGNHDDKEYLNYQSVLWKIDRLFQNQRLYWSHSRLSNIISNWYLWGEVESNLFFTDVHTVLTEMRKVRTTSYLAMKLPPNLKTLTYSSMERNPSLSLSACSNAEQFSMFEV